MTHLPPLNDSIAFALARMVDDAQKDKRDPSHSDIEFSVKKSNLTQADPKSQGQTVGKTKRVRAVLSWALENAFDDGRGFAGELLAVVRSCGGFRSDSPNYVGDEAVSNLRLAMESEGFVLASNGEFYPTTLDSLSGADLTTALEAYIRRAQKGAEDAALLAGTAKDLVEATAAHVLAERYGTVNVPQQFPSLLGQAFAALDLKTPADKPVQGEPPQHRLQRALYEAACAINTLRNKEGTGHGKAWLPTVTADEARHAVQVMGCVSELLLRTLKQKMGRT